MGQERREINLKTWEFSRDCKTWSQVQIPHDWAIAGPFDKKWDLQRVAITQNGETEATEKSGRSGALPWIGEGWYRTTVEIPQGYEAGELVFDGAMAEPRVSVNGQEAGYWAYGYNAFRVDVTPFLKKQPTSITSELAISVHLQNVEESSRWYPGAGLYRPVKLVLTKKTHIDDWSIYARTMSIDKDGAVVEVEARIVNPVKGSAQVFLKGPDGVTASSGDTRIEGDGKVYAKFKLKNPKLWSPETPYLYEVRVEVYLGHHEVLDSKTIKTGIRTVRVSREGGFQLNGQTRKIKGVCLHHDLGPLGAAVNKSALILQIRALKGMGCDAIRTAHNMPSTMQMEICDSMGMMVMAESFDMWLYPKCKNGYARFFKEWAVKDITNLVLNHRNHPSIVMWSIGNYLYRYSTDHQNYLVGMLCHILVHPPLQVGEAALQLVGADAAGANLVGDEDKRGVLSGKTIELGFESGQGIVNGGALSEVVGAPQRDAVDDGHAPSQVVAAQLTLLLDVGPLRSAPLLVSPDTLPELLVPYVCCCHVYGMVAQL